VDPIGGERKKQKKKSANLTTNRNMGKTNTEKQEVLGNYDGGGRALPRKKLGGNCPMSLSDDERKSLILEGAGPTNRGKIPIKRFFLLGGKKKWVRV